METPTASKFLKLAARSYEKGEYGKALQLVEEGLRFEPDNAKLLEMEKKASNALHQMSEKHGEEFSKIAEAEQYHLQSTWILHELQANI